MWDAPARAAVELGRCVEPQHVLRLLNDGVTPVTALVLALALGSSHEPLCWLLRARCHLATGSVIAAREAYGLAGATGGEVAAAEALQLDELTLQWSSLAIPDTSNSPNRSHQHEPRWTLHSSDERPCGTRTPASPDHFRPTQPPSWPASPHALGSLRVPSRLRDGGVARVLKRSVLALQLFEAAPPVIAVVCALLVRTLRVHAVVCALLVRTLCDLR